MAEKPSKNEFVLMKENPGNPKFKMRGNSRMTNHVGDNYLSFNLPTSDDHLPASALGALNETANVFSNSSKNETSAVGAKLCETVNKNTIQMTRVSVIEDFSKKKLNEPDFEVHPQMRRVKNYYRGGLESWEKSEVKVTKSRFLRRPKKKVIRNQTRREMGFHFQKKRDDEETLTFPDLLESFTRDKKLGLDEVNPVTGLVASAGSGKTTLLKRLAGKCAADSVASKSVSTTSNETEENMRIKMVRYMEMKNMKNTDDTDVSSFLFDGLYKNRCDEKKAYDWLLEHQSEAILYFDGLDQATWSIPTSNQTKMTPYQRANTTEIMYNILSRNLLPHVKIVITSREFKISELPAEARPEEIINLVGLRQADAEKLFVCLVGKRGAESWGKIETMARRLVNLVSIPVFLVLTAALTAIDPDSPPPITITELYSRIMLSLSRVENIRERDQIQIVIKKLKAMAHQGMVEGRVVFTKDDLKKYDLSMQDVRDLMIKVPGNNLLSRHLFEGDFIYFFCHQSLQEFFSASFIAEMSWFDFFNFSRKHLHESRWSVVRMFVSGIIHDKSEVSKFKKRIFCQQIRSRCEKRYEGVELLAAIYESKNDVLIQSLPHLPDVSARSLGPDEAHTFSSILARRGKVKNVDFCGYWLTDELLDIMVQNLKDRKIRVGNLNLSSNEFTAKGLKPFLAIMKADKIKIDIKHLKYFRYEDFDWNAITTIKWRHRNDDDVSMTNKGERIEIEVKTWKADGYFDKTPKAFETDLRLFLHYSEVTAVPSEFEIANFFRQTFIQVSFKNQIYVEQSDLRGMKERSVDWKISKMLLNCVGEKNVDSSLIEFCVEEFQVSFLDLVVDEETSFVPDNFLTEIKSHIAIDVKVHWMSKFTVSNDVTRLIPIVRQNQVDNLRLTTAWTIRLLLGGIERVIENCKVKKLTLVYVNEDHKSLMRHDKMVELGEEHSIEVDSVTWDDLKDTAWFSIYMCVW